MPPRGNGYRGCPGGRPLLFDDSSAKFDPIRSVHDKRVEVVVDSHITHSHIQRIVLASEETTVTHRVNHRPIKCQSRSWSQRGTEVNDSHHGDSPLLILTGPNRGKTLVRFNHPKTSETERRLDDIYLWSDADYSSYCCICIWSDAASISKPELLVQAITTDKSSNGVCCTVLYCTPVSTRTRRAALADSGGGGGA